MAMGGRVPEAVVPFEPREEALGAWQEVKGAVYTKVPDLSEKGSCKIFIAGAPQRVTRCNCGYLMRTTPHILL